MKKKLLFTPLLALTCLASCGTVVREFDLDKTQIFVTVFNGGYGTEWFNDLKEKWNAKNDKFEIIEDYKKLEAVDIITDVQTGDPDADIYISCGVDFQRGIYNDYFEDLSDVFNMTPEGDTRTIGNKMIDFDLWKDFACRKDRNDGGIYVLPHTETMMGMIFDYQLFVDNGWLSFATTEDEAELTNQGFTFTPSGEKLKFVSATHNTNYKAGEYILSKGRDGLFGTYDDGQPETLQEFEDMLDLMVYGNKKATTFIYSGKAENYINDLYASVIAQYMGFDNYRTLFNYNSGSTEIPMHGAQASTISLSNGNKVFKSEGVYQGLNFVEKYLASDKVFSRSTGYSYSHTDAQNDFLLGYKNAKGSPSFIVEGSWWENEAKTMFNSIAKETPDRGFGKREYRYMLTPSMTGQATATNKTVMGGSEYSGIVVAKQNNAEKLAKIKDFLAFMNSDENLQNFTKFSGCKKYFNYDLPDSILNSLTPFARNGFEIMSDKEHVSICPSRLYQAANPLTYTTTYISNCYIPLYNGASYTMFPARYFREEVDVDDLYSSKSSWLGYSDSQWADFITTTQAAGFYK